MAAVTFHDLRGASVFITGGGAGIGADLTLGFLEQGARVAFVQRSDASGFVDRAEAETGQRPLFLPCDVTDIAALHAAMDRAAEAHGAIRVLVNNAANDSRHTLDSVTVADWNASLSVNLRPHFFTAQKAAPGMRARKSFGKSLITGNYAMKWWDLLMTPPERYTVPFMGYRFLVLLKT